MLPYQVLFSDDGAKASEMAFQKLDQIIASAMKYKLHINICTMSVPGRWTLTTGDYEYIGEFDLFTNPDRQEEAESIWNTISARYADLPNSVLSFTPVWESQNHDLSTGLNTKSYTAEDVTDEYMRLIAAIQEASPDRYVVCELTANNTAEDIAEESFGIAEIRENYNNVLLECNFCEVPFVYANMTAVAGEHIDNCNRSMLLSLYPCAYYDVQTYISKNDALVMNGDLYKGTELTIYLNNVRNSGTINFVADGKVIYEETLSKADYAVKNPISRYYAYKESDKAITITLDEDYSELSIETNGSYIEWCGMTVTLPEEYNVSRWFVPSAYEDFLESGEAEYSNNPYEKETSTIIISPTDYNSTHVVTINDDISYTTDSIWAEANSETINSWGAFVSEFEKDVAVRIENANFSGEYLSSVDYYNDFYSMCEKYGFSWFPNDFNFNNYAYVSN